MGKGAQRRRERGKKEKEREGYTGDLQAKALLFQCVSSECP